MIIHKNVTGCFGIRTGNTISNFSDMFRSDTKEQVTITRYDELFSELHLDKITSNDFKVLCESTYKNKDTILVKYTDIAKLKHINVVNVQYNEYFDYYEQMSIFKKSPGNKFFENNNDWYLNCVSTHTLIKNKMEIFEKKFQSRDPKIIKKLKKLNHYAENNKLTLFDHWSGGFDCPLLKLRYFIRIDTFIPEDGSYGSDASFMTINNCAYNGTYNEKYLKMFYFVGTKFNNVKFINYTFLSCVFIGVDISMKSTLKFLNCKFQECSFYGSNCNISAKCFDKCTFDNQTKF